jgi:hypothetical protein
MSCQPMENYGIIGDWRSSRSAPSRLFKRRVRHHGSMIEVWHSAKTANAPS